MFKKLLSLVLVVLFIVNQVGFAMPIAGGVSGIGIDGPVGVTLTREGEFSIISLRNSQAVEAMVLDAYNMPWDDVGVNLYPFAEDKSVLDRPLFNTTLGKAMLEADVILKESARDVISKDMKLSDMAEQLFDLGDVKFRCWIEPGKDTKVVLLNDGVGIEYASLSVKVEVYSETNASTLKSGFEDRLSKILTIKVNKGPEFKGARQLFRSYLLGRGLKRYMQGDGYLKRFANVRMYIKGKSEAFWRSKYSGEYMRQYLAKDTGAIVGGITLGMGFGALQPVYEKFETWAKRKFKSIKTLFFIVKASADFFAFDESEKIRYLYAIAKNQNISDKQIKQCILMIKGGDWVFDTFGDDMKFLRELISFPEEKISLLFSIGSDDKYAFIREDIGKEKLNHILRHIAQSSYDEIYDFLGQLMNLSSLNEDKLQWLRDSFTVDKLYELLMENDGSKADDILVSLRRILDPGKHIVAKVLNALFVNDPDFVYDFLSRELKGRMSFMRVLSCDGVSSWFGAQYSEEEINFAAKWVGDFFGRERFLSIWEYMEGKKVAYNKLLDGIFLIYLKRNDNALFRSLSPEWWESTIKELIDKNCDVYEFVSNLAYVHPEFMGVDSNGNFQWTVPDVDTDWVKNMVLMGNFINTNYVLAFLRDKAKDSFLSHETNRAQWLSSALARSAKKDRINMYHFIDNLLLDDSLSDILCILGQNSVEELLAIEDRYLLDTRIEILKCLSVISSSLERGQIRALLEGLPSATLEEKIDLVSNLMQGVLRRVDVAPEIRENFDINLFKSQARKHMNEDSYFPELEAFIGLNVFIACYKSAGSNTRRWISRFLKEKPLAYLLVAGYKGVDVSSVISDLFSIAAGKDKRLQWIRDRFGPQWLAYLVISSPEVDINFHRLERISFFDRPMAKMVRQFFEKLFLYGDKKITALLIKNFDNLDNLICDDLLNKRLKNQDISLAKIKSLIVQALNADDISNPNMVFFVILGIFRVISNDKFNLSQIENEIKLLSVGKRQSFKHGNVKDKDIKKAGGIIERWIMKGENSNILSKDELWRLLSILDKHMQGNIVDRKKKRIIDGIKIMGLFLNEEFNKISDDSAMRSILKTNYTKFNAMSDSLKKEVIIATIFRDVGSINGGRDWLHHRIGKNMLMGLLEPMDYEQSFLKNIANLVYYHGLYSHLGTDFLPSDVLLKKDDVLKQILFISIFDDLRQGTDNRLTNNILRKMDTFSRKESEIILDYRKFVEYRLGAFFVPMLFVDENERIELGNKIKQKLASMKKWGDDNFIRRWSARSRVYAPLLFSYIGSKDIEKFVDIMVDIDDVLSAKLKDYPNVDVVIDTDIDIMGLFSTDRDLFNKIMDSVYAHLKKGSLPLNTVISESGTLYITIEVSKLIPEDVAKDMASNLISGRGFDARSTGIFFDSISVVEKEIPKILAEGSLSEGFLYNVIHTAKQVKETPEQRSDILQNVEDMDIFLALNIAGVSGDIKDAIINLDKEKAKQWFVEVLPEELEDAVVLGDINATNCWEFLALLAKDIARLGMVEDGQAKAINTATLIGILSGNISPIQYLDNVKPQKNSAAVQSMDRGGITLAFVDNGVWF